MPKTLKWILVFVAAGLLFLLVVIDARPTDMHVERSATFAASPQAVFAQLNDLHNWEAWSPWAKRDPKMATTYAGEPAGVGAIYTWKGNAEVGEGRMTIIDSEPNQHVGIKLEFIAPFAATNTSDFKIAPKGNETTLTWSIDGKNDFMSKAIGLVMDMDQMIGSDFEAGLASMKSVLEKDQKP